jgi:hypothetical protein
MDHTSKRVDCGPGAAHLAQSDAPDLFGSDELGAIGLQPIRVQFVPVLVFPLLSEIDQD